VIGLALGVLALVVGIGAAGAQDGTTTTAASDAPPVLVVAHRGASATAPEHTGPAYDRAVLAGADVLECDVQVTADDQLVCVHDATVDRTNGGTPSGAVGDFTLDELREMDFGAWFGPEFAGTRIVTLDEQLSCYSAIDPTMQLYIETKTAADAGDHMETLLVEVLDAHGLIPDGEPDARESPVIIQSFDSTSLETVRELAPGLPLAFLLNATTPEIDAGQLPDVDVLAPNAAVLQAPDLVTTAHDAGLEVHTWTVDDPAQITALIDAGIDGFFTNTPEVARGVVDDAGRGSGRETVEASDSATVPDCPDGMGVGLAAAEETTTTGPADTAQEDDDQAASDDTDDGDDSGAPIVPIVIGALVVAAVVAFLVVRSQRRSG
jgi:glycerophosphoryl diester phosphodiesterase